MLGKSSSAKARECCKRKIAIFSSSSVTLYTCNTLSIIMNNTVKFFLKHYSSATINSPYSVEYLHEINIDIEIEFIIRIHS